MILLTRFYHGTDRTIGRLEYAGKSWWTIECPWLANKPSKSCIPEGDYRLERYDSPRFGARTWQVTPVDGRSHIAVHAANYANQLEGCIALGNALYRNLEGVEDSRTEVDEFYSLTESEDTLLIRVTSGAVWC